MYSIGMNQMNMFRNKKLEPGYGGDIVCFTLGLIATIFGIRVLFEGVNWIPVSLIAFILATPLILYGISYRLVDKKEVLK